VCCAVSLRHPWRARGGVGREAASAVSARALVPSRSCSCRRRSCW
jgi:hypothetical protein